MSALRWITISGVLLFLGLGLAIPFITQWQKNRTLEDQWTQLAAIRQLAKEGHPEQALLQLIYQAPELAENELRESWVAEEIRLAAQLRHLHRIEHWSNFADHLLLKNSSASIWWARMLLAEREFSQLNDLIEKVKGSGKLSPPWILLSADIAIVSGEKANAIEILESSEFAGNPEIARLLRLASLHADKPEAMWVFLQSAFKMNPRHPDVRSFLGQYFITQNQQTLAEREWVAAFRAAPENPIFINQLFNLYIQQARYHLAVDFLESALPQAGAQEMFREKLTFWITAATGHQNPEVDPQPEDERQAPRFLLRQSPESAWLKILERLEKQDWTSGLSLIQTLTPDQRKLAPNLHLALQRVLQAHLSEDATPPAPLNGIPPAQMPAVLSDWLYQPSLPYSREKTQIEVTLASLFLAEGWLEAALKIHQHVNPSNEFEPEYLYGIAQALRYNRTPDLAIEWLGNWKQKSPALDLLQGELLLGEGELEESIPLLKKVANEPGLFAERAAFLLAETAWALGDIVTLEFYLETLPVFEGSSLKSIYQGRLAAQAGNFKKARANFSPLVDRYPEAAAFLARLEFEEGNWDEALVYTQRLSSQFPGHRQWHHNLDAIRKAESNANR